MKGYFSISKFSPPFSLSYLGTPKYRLGYIFTSGTFWGLISHLTSRKQKAPSLTLPANKLSNPSNLLSWSFLINKSHEF